MLPHTELIFIGIANLLYGSYSGSLVLRTLLGKKVRRRWITLLVTANLCWALVCVGIFVQNWASIHILGAMHISFEGMYVTILALFEYYLVRPLAVR
ncbi:hypothetical protein CH373_12535 [Leptospira perolatii]|uniref:Uncharacterized protein n=2 Tax=Leptospira perolatii TaxID=2023191 RepID=A0A2M9ZLD4_9LEPT|nr:hypothetical protein CH360_06435 [Leptospira perolatii]PJZ72878.1 hypothetical protein CH373_12535 [Leptospira perolatii]